MRNQTISQAGGMKKMKSNEEGGGGEKRKAEEEIVTGRDWEKGQIYLGLFHRFHNLSRQIIHKFCCCDVLLAA